MEPDELKHIVEAALLAADRPLSLDHLQGLFEEHERPERDTLRAALAALEADYADRGIELREVASGYRVQVRDEMAAWVSRLWAEKPPRYSRALLETLALIAYRQPITRGEIEDIRGVSVSSSIMKTLQERDWIRIVGHRDVPGQPAMYATTREFLDYFDLKTLGDLPPLAALRDIDSINAELELVSDDEAAAGGEAEASDAPDGDDDDGTPARAAPPAGAADDGDGDEGDGDADGGDETASDAAGGRADPDDPQAARPETPDTVH